MFEEPRKVQSISLSLGENPLTNPQGPKEKCLQCVIPMLTFLLSNRDLYVCVNGKCWWAILGNTRIHKQKPHSDTTSIVPFGERPGSAKLNMEHHAQLMKAMDELDNMSNMPEGLDPLVWDHFCVTRRAKVENEQKVYNEIWIKFNSFLVYYYWIHGLC